MSMRTTLTSNSYHSKYVRHISQLVQVHNFRNILHIIFRNESSASNYLSKFTVLVVVAFTKKEERKQQQAQQTHNLLVSILVLVRVSYLFCAVCIC